MPPINRAVFFDRDGVLNADTDYPYLPEHIQWIDGVFEAVKAANEAGYKAFVVTNQAGVARGYYSEQHVQDLHAWMSAEFAKHGARIDEFAYCPHHPTPQEGLRVTGHPVAGQYAIVCECRKPKPGMLKTLIEKHDIDAAASFLIGDRESDLQAAAAAGVKGVLFTGGNLALMVKALLKR